jgi:hypothetical protein
LPAEPGEPGIGDQDRAQELRDADGPQAVDEEMSPAYTVRSSIAVAEMALRAGEVDGRSQKKLSPFTLPRSGPTRHKEVLRNG